MTAQTPVGKSYGVVRARANSIAIIFLDIHMTAIEYDVMNGFTAIAEPTRRSILDLLRTGERDVGSLVDALDLPQPLVSKHLRVLRDAGAVEVELAGKRRVYRLAGQPLPDVLAWVRPYVELWSTSLDRLEEALDEDDS